MTIEVGDTIPEARFRTMGPDGPAEITTGELLSGRKVVLFGVPGAFTPTCHNNHLPGFLERYDDLKAKGVDTIAVVSVNDLFVMDAWSKASGADGRIVFLADGSAEFTRTIGMEMDASGFGMGLRSKRYAMIVEDGVVRSLDIDETRGSTEKSGAEAVLARL